MTAYHDRLEAGAYSDGKQAAATSQRRAKHETPDPEPTPTDEPEPSDPE